MSAARTVFQAAIYSLTTIWARSAGNRNESPGHIVSGDDVKSQSNKQKWEYPNELHFFLFYDPVFPDLIKIFVWVKQRPGKG